MVNCTVVLVDDQQHEGDETFTLRLAEAKGGETSDAAIGTDTATVTITDTDDGWLGF